MRFALGLAAVLITMVVSEPAAQLWHRLTINVRDERTGAPTVARVGVFDHDNLNTSYAPSGREAHLYQYVGWLSYFYVDGTTTMWVPEDTVRVWAGKGFEYLPVEAELLAVNDTSVTFDLHQFIDMDTVGWWSGDTHVHISHPPIRYDLDATHLLLAAEGEDLNFINSMEEEGFFTGALDPVSTPQRLIYFSKEQRNADFAHLTVMGLKQWIPDYGCFGENVACGHILNADLYAQFHAQPGEIAVVATHPFPTFDMWDLSGWPGGGVWRAMPLDLAAGTVDAMDLVNYHNTPPPEVVEPYFKALNAGFRLPPSAGTDCSLGSAESSPAGGIRVYVLSSTPPAVDSWIAALKAGRSFVTNYPLFTGLTLGGAEIGDVVVHDGELLQGTVAVHCAQRIDSVEIIGDTGVLQVLTPPGDGATSFSTSFEVDPDSITWLVARATGPKSGWHPRGPFDLFAQTAPIYLEFAGGNPLGSPRTGAVEYFVAWLDELELLFDLHGEFPGDSSRASFDSAMAFAREYFRNIQGGPPTGIDATLHAVWTLRSVWPNPFNPDVSITYYAPPGGGHHCVVVYDATGRRVRTLFIGDRPMGEYRLQWNGRSDSGVRVASGVYFVRLAADGAPASVRKIVLLR